MFERYAERVPAALVVVGCLLAGITAVESLARVGGPEPTTLLFLTGLATSGPFIGVVLVGGYRLPATSLSPQYYSRIAEWCLAGAVFFCVLLSVFAPLLFPSPFDQIGLIRWGVLIGTGGGVLAGFFNARVVEQRVTAERARVRVQEAEQRQ